MRFMRKRDLINTFGLKEFIYNRLKSSEVPISEIIASDVFFADTVYGTGIFLYSRKNKYYIKYVTQYKSEECTDCFDSPNDLLYSLVKYQISQKAIHETGGYKYRQRALEMIKTIDDDYYDRALNDFNNDTWL